MAKSKRQQQSLAKLGLLVRLRSYGRDHVRSLIFSLGKLYRQPFATTLTLLMIAIALALPASLFVLLNNLQSVTQKWDDAGQITIFLNSSASPDAINKLRERILSNTEIESVDYVTAEAALKEFTAHSEVGHLAEGLAENPLPPTLIVLPRTASKNNGEIQKLVDQFQTFKHVEHVQVDMQWLQRLQSITDIVRRVISIIGILLGLSVLLVVGNSIRLDIQNRSEEIQVTKLIGATNRYIRRPFLYGGLWYGLLGGVLALILVFSVLLVIKSPVQSLIELYETSFQLIFPTFKQSLALLLTSVLLSLFGSSLAVGRHISKIEPT